MSTTFAIIKKCKCGEIKDKIEIAHRSGQGVGKPVKIKWLHPFVDVLRNNREVYPIDNTNQGVYNTRNPIVFDRVLINKKETR